MLIVQQSTPFSLTISPPPYPLLPAPPKRLCLPAPKIAGLLPAPKNMNGQGHRAAPTSGQLNEGDNLAFSDSSLITHHSSLSFPQPSKRVVRLEVANPLQLLDIRKDFDAWWEQFERQYGRVKTIAEMNDELEAKYPGFKELFVR